ncbi:MAG TPA: glycosyl hydrolase family 8 [Mycobacterium sp.]|jgi:endoglucanase|nr:glycosyl hydrolase family 8 [Mycobacterium sp.]
MNTKLRNAIRSVLVLVLVAASGWGIAKVIDPRVTIADIAAMREDAARAAGNEFLDEYAESDGRVVRRDEGGDVVSEGQAYGMLIAVAVGDQTRFRSIWDWTKDHLRRPDGLLSWRWADDQVIDSNSAADADLDAARALMLAGSRFNAPELTEDGKRLGAVVLQTESVTIGTRVAPASDDAVPIGSGVVGAGQVLVAGNWSTTPPYTVNAGYFSPRAEAQFAQVSADHRWMDLSRTQRVLGWQLVGTSSLPPDWANVDAAGTAVPTGPPGGGPVQFGLDAARVPVRYAESCDPADRALAAAMRPILAAPGDVPALRNLDGSAASDWQHPVAVVASAATEKAAGDADAASERLDAATALQRRYPTYYGAAWVALGRIMLSTSLLGACPGRS